MSIPPGSLGRGCAATYPEPVNEHEVLGAQFMEEHIYNFNCRTTSSPLADIVYRSSDKDYDRLHHVFRWTRERPGATYRDVFGIGFRAKNEHNTRDEIFYNLDHYIHQAGRPLDPDRRESYAFISTTLSTSWRPTVAQGTTDILCRFEIYAPGGIWIAETLGDRYQADFRRQDEVTFVDGIAPEYIRSVQRFRVNPNAGTARFPRLERVDNEIIINGNFRPHPPMLIFIHNPVYYCMNEDEHGRRRRIDLTRNVYYPPQDRKKREVFTEPKAVDWYASEVANIGTYINAAFRSSRTNEAYIFMNNEYLLLNYAPGMTDDRVVNGPLLICDGFPSLAGTVFAEWGIDCSFGSHDRNKAFIFSGNLCAYINYVPGTTDDKIIKGPITIAAMFPFFKGTVFESGIDSAFEAHTKYEAYLFKGNQYALINYSTPKLIAARPINQGFSSLRGTIFESGIDAAFASHRKKEAYLFKGDSYALIDFASGSKDDRIIGGIKKILPNWSSLRSVLPHKNYGVDHDYNHITTAPAHRVHDEL
ncbi:hypothetical protein HS088_TW08G00624 [Tripterygium wilfordii]|uniref:Pierisin-like domain-containing protein n=1 Tax=Tripterygium wilfordii TaxID=458696 RepID=A0A7J7DCH9_TRIWF|nr:uncharacterized protein LOC120003398 [Tripterygium wilfordii]KAF5744033.1 hypothetical protein HS088_TW08G00624 [Tripterygium wilfordii]